MKLVSYLNEEHDQLAFLVDGFLYDCDLLHPALPNSMNMFLHYWEDMYPVARQVNEAIKDGRLSKEKGIAISGVQLLAPVPFPTSCREGAAFRRYRELVTKNSGLPITESLDQYPDFYFTNHQSIQGPGEIKCMPDHLEQLDFGLEAAVVICKHARNITAKEANSYIGGLMIMNGMSANALQQKEMMKHLSPAKSRDFATVTGPCLVTLDELVAYEVPCHEGHIGMSWNLSMKASINGIQVSESSLSEMDWTFAELIERSAYGVTLQPGDVISSGISGAGCFWELNAAGRLKDPDYAERWLQEGDVINMEIDGLDKLSSTIVKEESDFSILTKKKE
jgi:fumarylacetoacetate (FAA) hydrolase